jgi:threonine aldolase
MRQVGVLAAAGLVALNEMVERLADDHRRARRLAAELADIRGVIIDPEQVQTNIVIFRLPGPTPPYDALVDHLESAGVRVTGLWGRGVRLVTHRMIGDNDVERALTAMRKAQRASLLGS